MIATLYNLDNDSKKIVDIEFCGTTLSINGVLYTIDTSNISHDRLVVLSFTLKENYSLLLEIVLGCCRLD